MIPRQYIKMAKDRCIKITIDDVRLGNFRVWREDTPLGRSYYFKYEILLTKHDTKVMAEKIKYQLRHTKLDFSTMVYDGTTFDGKFDGDLMIKSPIAKNGVLISNSEKMIDLPDVYSLRVRGVFSPSLILRMETPQFTEKVTKFTLYSLNEVDNCIRYMGEEVFPDYFTDAGKDSVSADEVDEFMKLY